jgi:hypothetical protein
MSNLGKLEEISLRLDHLESAGDWLARSLVHSDPAASQTGSLVTVLVEDIRDKLLALVAEMEQELSEALEEQIETRH